MILVDAGSLDERSFDDMILFASQLTEHGHRAIVDEATLPEDASRAQRYDAAPYLADPGAVEISRAVIIGAESLADDTLLRLRPHLAESTAPVAAIGRFSSRQGVIAAETRLAYAFGREARVVDLSALRPGPLPVPAVSPLAISAAPERPADRRSPLELFVFLPEERLEEPSTLALLAAMDNVPLLRLNVLTSAKAKERIAASRHTQLSIYRYAELLPRVLGRLADLAAFYGEGIPGERMAAFALELMGSGKPVIDATEKAAFRSSGAPVLRGPSELAALLPFIEGTVLPNLEEIGRTAMTSPWTEARRFQRLAAQLGLDARRTPMPRVPTEARPRRTVFFPTNGNGLGHARRCTLVAAEFERPGDVVFAAFPSCVPLVRSRGFSALPLVPKSGAHEESYANDVITERRLARVIGPEDRLVFDGGYVFDSVFRIIKTTRCRATWIRRGLLLPGQVDSVQTERETAFSTVVVPSEAFDELNVDYSFRPSVHRVGPIVDLASGPDPQELREKLAERFETGFDRLVVTMLGGGVAADRTAQLTSLCALAEAQSGCLHLIVVWPNAVVAPGLFGWRATRVVRTRASLALCRAADFVVSAAGYNSYHELLYHRIPAIFLPQAAPYLDDQERRARAASERGLAETVAAHELVKLGRTVEAWLEGPDPGKVRAALADVRLPEPGTRAAAALIEREPA